MTDLVPASATSPPNVLIVEDESMIRELLTLYLEDWGACVTAVASADEGRDEILSRNWSLLLSDVQTPGVLNGVDLAWITSQQKPQTRIIVMSGYYEFAGRVLPEGAVFLPKPWPLTRLNEIITGELAKAVKVECTLAK
ncbi:response regulator [Pseudomonas sp. SbB1]|uniref:Response regulator receiver protein n=1 Tax=Pseudomonas putida (strain GB-1) TaxID=76869 RepID=B0KFG0_PSEPG|nr:MULTISPECIES: response regulator [Pseudomonas]ABY98883.1 response regulator receiver protein [Pseudomonas putida GB-1]MBP0708909.1 response regulator [Pseudomonas sp. T34]MCK2188346.1 response regulator [Pseudomonas sp. MB04B]MDD2083961.1 response regulator [Pseudomonas putida]MDD2093137.1 response regulator [Pseudomonas putida]